MTKGIGAIPTVYAERLYRSRLEARWAVFFDMMGWPYEYEPFDCCGWIPDFIVTPFHPEYSLQVLVEVKPVTDFNEIAQSAADKIESTRVLETYACLIVGASIRNLKHPYNDDEYPGLQGGRLGWYHQRKEASKEWLDGWRALLWMDRGIADAWERAGNRVQWKRPA